VEVVYDSSLSNQQKQWFTEGLILNEYPDWPAIDVTLTVTVVTEPPCAGHKDTMCTTTDGLGGANIYIRQGFDDPKSPINSWLNGTLEETKRFFLETVNHELGHVVSFTLINTDELKSTAAALFTLHGAEGEGYRVGTLDDWNPLDAAHGDRIQESIAEVFKDAYLADNIRILENNSNWDITEENFITLMEMILPPTVISPGTDGWHSDNLYPAGLFSDIDNSNPGDNGGSMWQGCSAKFTDVPAGAMFGVPDFVVLDMTGSTCMSFGGFVRGDYYEFIECPTGHAPPAVVSPAWGDEVPGDLAHPYTGGHPHIQLGSLRFRPQTAGNPPGPSDATCSIGQH
jgi:hypothetical protein